MSICVEGYVLYHGQTEGINLTDCGVSTNLFISLWYILSSRADLNTQKSPNPNCYLVAINSILFTHRKLIPKKEEEFFHFFFSWVTCNLHIWILHTSAIWWIKAKEIRYKNPRHDCTCQSRYILNMHKLRRYGNLFFLVTMKRHWTYMPC